MGKRYTVVDLSGMKMAELRAHIDAEGLGVTVNKAKTKARVMKEILAAYELQDRAETQTTETQAQASRPVNPALEDNTQDPYFDDYQPTDGRGGAREGAGRPKGMDAERARMTHLSECPHPVVKGAIQLLFETWADGVGCREVALTPDEANELALPWTNVLEYMGIAQRIPVWLELAIVCTWNTVNVFKMKLRIAREYRASQAKTVESQEQRQGDSDNATS